MNTFFEDRTVITDEDVKSIADLTQTSEDSVRQIIDYYSQFYADNNNDTHVCGCLHCYLNSGEKGVSRGTPAGGAANDIGLSA